MFNMGPIWVRKHWQFYILTKNSLIHNYYYIFRYHHSLVIPIPALVPFRTFKKIILSPSSRFLSVTDISMILLKGDGKHQSINQPTPIYVSAEIIHLAPKIVPQWTVYHKIHSNALSNELHYTVVCLQRLRRDHILRFDLLLLPNWLYCR